MVDRGRASCGVCSVLLAWLGACSLDTSGLGSGSDAVPGADDDTSSSEDTAPGSSTGAASGQVGGDTTVDPSSDASGGSSSSSQPTDGDDSTGAPADPCADPAPVTIEIDVPQAMLAAPMQLANSPTEGPYVYSEVAGQGTASFQFQVPCQDEFRAWARVYDPGVGFNGLDVGHPDSYFVAFDGDDDTVWLYGCQTLDAGVIGGAWSWERLMDNAFCGDTDFRRTLSPGTHLLHLTNREDGNHAADNVAAVAHVVITSDPSYVP